MRHYTVILMLVSLFVLGGCSHERHLVYRSTSPDGSAEIQLTTFLHFGARPGEVAELQISTNRRNQVIKTWETPVYDLDPCLVVAAWSSDSARVIALFRNCFHESDLVAFDVRSHVAIDVKDMRPALAAQIRSQYAVPEKISDPIAWATQSEEARLAFKPATAREKAGQHLNVK
jgi:hypothetical protein